MTTSQENFAVSITEKTHSHDEWLAVVRFGLHLDFGGTGQGFGGYALYLPKSFSHHQVLSVAGHHIFRILEIAGVEKWSRLKGRTIRVETSRLEIKRIGHIVKDDWYCPSADFKAALDSSANGALCDGDEPPQTLKSKQ